MTDITLKEIQEICINQLDECNKCPMFSITALEGCLAYKLPENYDLAYLEQKIKEWREKNAISKN